MAREKRSGDPPEIDLVFEGAMRVDDEHRPPSFHAVGHDPLGAVAASVSDTLEQLRQQRLEARAAGIVAGRGSNHDHAIERMAQVVQATSVPVDTVVVLLAGTIRSSTGLRLTGRPTVRDGLVVFDGYLRLRRPPTRRRIELRTYPTASGNLTVLELLPRRDWMPQTRRYLRVGVPAITELTDRLELAAT